MARILQLGESRKLLGVILRAAEGGKIAGGALRRELRALVAAIPQFVRSRSHVVDAEVSAIVTGALEEGYVEFGDDQVSFFVTDKGRTAFGLALPTDVPETLEPSAPAVEFTPPAEVAETPTDADQPTELILETGFAPPDGPLVIEQVAETLEEPVALPLEPTAVEARVEPAMVDEAPKPKRRRKRKSGPEFSLVLAEHAPANTDQVGPQEPEPAPQSPIVGFLIEEVVLRVADHDRVTVTGGTIEREAAETDIVGILRQFLAAGYRPVIPTSDQPAAN